MSRRTLASALLLFAVAQTSHVGAEQGGVTVTFPYEQKRLLYSRNGGGGLAYVTPGAARGATLPVVVFLHGMNPEAQVHPWFSGPYPDLRAVVEPLVASGKVAPFVLAAPTHTRFATGATVMWPDFDLRAFLDATEVALRGAAHVDRARVIVIGTSAAGCNPSGGILSDGVRSAGPMQVVAIDTCVDGHVEEPLGALASTTRVRFYWQKSWARPVADLARVCEGCKVEELAVSGTTPHLAIVPEALRKALPELLPPR